MDWRPTSWRLRKTSTPSSKDERPMRMESTAWYRMLGEESASPSGPQNLPSHDTNVHFSMRSTTVRPAQHRQWKRCSLR